jgi:hypothetical protein
MTLLDDYLQHVEKTEIPKLQKQLQLLESGKMHLGERHGTGAWTDTTPRHIDHLKTTIQMYESLLSEHRDKKRT